jgi:hypothetical protein
MIGGDMSTSRTTTPLVLLGQSAAIAALPAQALAGFSFDLNLHGLIDAAVKYPSLNGYPYNAVFHNQVGSLRVGDLVSVSMSIEVESPSSLTISNYIGQIDGIFEWTFGGSSFHSGGATLRPDRSILLPGEFSDRYDVVQLAHVGLRSGPGGPTTLSTIVSLYGELGSLITSDRQLIPTTLDEFVAAIDGAVLWINTPNSFLTGAFVTDPSYTIVPAPGVLLTLVGALAAQRRRPARTTLPRRLPS